MFEEWKQIEKYPRYWVSNRGRVKSTIGTEKILQPNFIGQYVYVKLYQEKEPTEKSKPKLIKIHRLVAQAFCKNYSIGCEVHHINKNGRDNRAENLLCLSPKEHRELHKAEKAASKEVKNGSR